MSKYPRINGVNRDGTLPTLASPTSSHNPDTLSTSSSNRSLADLATYNHAGLVIDIESLDVSLLQKLLPLSKEEMLEELTKLLRKLPADIENSHVLAFAAWEYLTKNELWKSSYACLVDFQVAVGWHEEISPLVEAGRRSLSLRRAVNALLQTEWKCDLVSLLEPADTPEIFSKHFLQHLRRLIGLCSREVGLQKISDAKQHRQNRYRSRSCLAVLACDLEQAVKLVKADIARSHVAQSDSTTHSHLARASRRGAAPASSIDFNVSNGHCACPPNIQAKFAGELWDRSQVPLDEVVTLAECGQDGAGGLAICHRHLRTLAGKGFGLYTNRDGVTLKHRVLLALSHTKKSSLDILKKKEIGWFRSQSGDGSLNPSPGLWRWTVQEELHSFSFNSEQIFERFAGVGSWSIWLKDGNIILPDAFSYLCAGKIFQLIDSEFNAYKYHTNINLNGKTRNGWTRTMFYSLIQQVVRQDPLYYAVMAAARPDQNWRLISYPYYTKDTTIGESTGFKHLDLNVPALLRDGRGANIIQSTLSLDDEEEDGCTILVPGFHKHIREWWKRVEGREAASNGLTTNVSKTYLREDEESFGNFVPVPCPRGGVRISRPEIIHGSTPLSTRRRRTIFVWHCGIDEDHRRLDNAESETWDEISKCHRDMEVPLKSTSGHGFAYGRPEYRFPASVRLASSSAIGDAMVGLRRWDEPSVLSERDILLGPNDAKAWEFVYDVRKRLIENYHASFNIMVKAEEAYFGDYSYFADPASGLLRAMNEGTELESFSESSPTGSLDESVLG